MTTMKNSIHDNANGLDYTLVNDHYLPNLTVAAPTEQHPTGRCEEQLALIIRQMQEAEGVDEALKAADQLEWVRRMNSIRNRAEETILREIVFNIYKNQAFA